ncbi:hypothetical protein QZH41_015218 [Actinostola sp. cb2023]|nr:hypothetical protein QZH41_015218 [Actinostola sp. cb2023]
MTNQLLLIIQVLNDTPTGTYLDGAIFDSIVKKYNKKPDKPDKVKDWISIDVSQLQSKNQCATCTLESLVDLGILDKKKKMIGNKYPTVRPGIEENLVKLIRAVALDGQEPSSYIRALLTLTRTADNLLCSVDPVLQKHFSKEEYVNAKKRINALVGLGKKGKGKYQAV